MEFYKLLQKAEEKLVLFSVSQLEYGLLFIPVGNQIQIYLMH